MIYKDPMFWRKKKPQKVTLTITGQQMDESMQYFEIGGIKYGVGEVVDVEVGSTANCYIDGSLALNLKVVVNGVTVKSVSVSPGMGSVFVEYPYTVTKNATIHFAANPMEASITITEET